MMTQIHVHLKTFENITCVDSDYPLKKTALANSEETSDVGADNSVTLEGKEKGGLKVWSERGLGRRTEVSMDDGGLKTEAWDKRRRC